MPRTIPLPPPSGLPLSLAFQYPQLLYAHNTTLFRMWLLFCQLLDSEDEGTANLKNTGNFLPSDTPSQIGRF